MVLTMELNLGRDKTGDVGKFHTRDNMLLISNPFSLKRPFGHFILLFDIFLFNCILRQTGTLLMMVMLMVFTN